MMRVVRSVIRIYLMYADAARNCPYAIRHRVKWYEALRILLGFYSGIAYVRQTAAVRKESKGEINIENDLRLSFIQIGIEKNKNILYNDKRRICLI